MGIVNKDGALYMATGIDNSGLKQDAAEAESIIEDIGKKSEEVGAKMQESFEIGTDSSRQFVDGLNKAGSSIDSIVERMRRSQEETSNIFQFDPNMSAFDAVKQQLEIQKKTVADIEAYYEEAMAHFNKVNISTSNPEIIAEREKASKLYKEIRANLNAEKQGLQELEKEYKKLSDEEDKRAKQQEKNANKQITTLQQIRQISEEMRSLRGADGVVSNENIQRYEELKKKLSELGTSYRIVQQEQKALTTAGSAHLAGIIQGITGLSGAFSAGQGVMSLFVKDNEKLAAIQTKLQAAMAITIGLQQVSNTLHATSSFRINTVTKVTQLWSNAQKSLNTSIGLSTGLSKAFLSGGIMLLAAGIIYLITQYKEWNKQQNELKTQLSEARASIQEQVVRVKILDEVLKNNNKSYSERNNALKQLKDIMPGYNAYLSKEGKLIEDNTGALQKYVKELLNVEMAKKTIAKLADAQTKLDEFNDSLTEGDKLLLNPTKELQEKWDKYGAQDSDRVKRLKKEQAELQTEVGRLSDIAKEYIASDATTYEDFTKGYWEAQQKNAQARLYAMKDFQKGSEEWNQVLAEYNQATIKLKAWNVKPKTDKEIESAADKAKKLEQELLALQDKLNNEQLQQELNSQQKLIDKQEDGFKKQYAQNELNYKKELQQIKEFEDSKTKERNEAILKFGASKIPIELSTENVKKQTEILRTEALSSFSKTNNDILKSLTDKYQSYADQRLEIENRYNKDIEILIQQRDKSATEEQRSLLNRSIAKATADKGKELMSFDFDRLKESPEYVRAFEDLKNTSSETLNSLLTQLEDAKQTAAKVLSPDQLREYTSTIQSIMDELTERNPYKALIDKKKKLAEASTELALSEKQLKDVQSGFGVITNLAVVNGKLTASYLSEADAIKNVNKAKDKYTKANNNVVVAEKKILGQIEELNSALSNLSNSIGGTSGLIIGLMGDIGLFATKSIEGISKVADKSATAISNIEKASVILTIISTAIQLMQKLDELMPDAYDKYEKYDEKIEQINNLRDAVNDYELAVLKAKQAETSWFGNDQLQNLKDYKDQQSKIFESYKDKLLEEQAIYQNKKGGGWLTGTLNYGLLGGIDKIFGTNVLGNNYKKGTTAAINNLRIETRKKSSGFLGSGIGGKSQKTENLVDWAKNNGFGDLFDKDGWINVSAADAILGQYGDKLVGRTKETLEEMKALKEQYDEYIKQLREYVNSMYEPLADNMVSAIWDWLDEGKSALDSFKDYAKDTFRDIVSDMIKTIILKDVFGDYKDKIAGLYEEYSKGNLTEKELSDAIAEETAVVVDRYDKTLPMLQDTVNAINQGIKDSTGIDLKDTNSSQSTTKGGFETMTQDQAGEMNGRLTGMHETDLRIESIIILMRLDISKLRDYGLITADGIIEMKQTLIYCMDYLESIAKSTNELYQIKEDIAYIKKNGLKIN